MNNLSDLNIENVPGVDSFKFAPVSYIVGISDAVTHKINTLTWDTGKAWLTGYSLPGSLNTNEAPEESAQGTLYKCSLSGIIPNDTNALVDQLIEMKQYRFIVAYKDINGNIKLLGSSEAPCKFDFQLSKTNDSNHYAYTFSCVTINEPPYFLDSSQY